MLLLSRSFAVSIKHNAGEVESIEEDVHLFEEVPSKRGYLRYKGQMICTGYELVDAPDTERQMRRAIRFELTPLDVGEWALVLVIAAAGYGGSLLSDRWRFESSAAAC